MFIRVLRSSEQIEILINTEMISKIEVSYAIHPEGSQAAYKTDLEHGIANPKAIRLYKVFVGGETVMLASDPNDPVVNVIEAIYKNSVKANEPAS
jgi:hypothetical protein